MFALHFSEFRRHAYCVLLASFVASGCNVGGGGGGGPSDPPLPARALRLKASSPDPVLRGAQVYESQGCRLCHGDAGKGGVANANSETAGKINGLTLVKEGYSKDELVKKIQEGQQEVGKDNKQGPTPPLRMPVYGAWLSKGDVTDLATYLLSLYPKGPATAAADDWDKDDDKADDDKADDEESDTKAAKPGPKAHGDAGAAKNPGKGGHK